MYASFSARRLSGDWSDPLDPSRAPPPGPLPAAEESFSLARRLRAATTAHSVPALDLNVMFVLRDSVAGSILEPRHLRTVRALEQRIKVGHSTTRISLNLPPLFRALEQRIKVAVTQP